MSSRLSWLRPWPRRRATSTWLIPQQAGEVIACISVAPFIIPVFVMLARFFGAEALSALRGDQR